MNIVTPLKWMGCLTLTALIYTHMQMQIFELAYRGKKIEKKIQQMKDENGMLTHQILALKSANHLGQKLLDKDDGLKFMGHDRVMTINKPNSQKNVVPKTISPATPKPNIISNVLSMLSPRDASAWDK